MRFADVLVPETVKRQLIGAVHSHRVSHAQLFYGLEGTHALALALAYAQYVNCPNRTEEDSCGECPSCRQFSQLAHPDLHFYLPHPAGKELSSYNYYDEWRSLFLETNGLFSLNDWYRKIGMENKQGIINKEDVELLLQQTALKSYESEYKIFIIWMVEKLNGQVAPKLLKTLEEPDGKTLFLLITANYDQVLNTILSRSQLLKINRFNNKELAEILQREKGCDAITARRMALMAENNLISALRNGEFPEEEKEQFALFRVQFRHTMGWKNGKPRPRGAEAFSALCAGNGPEMRAAEHPVGPDGPFGSGRGTLVGEIQAVHPCRQCLPLLHHAEQCCKRG